MTDDEIKEARALCEAASMHGDQWFASVRDASFHNAFRTLVPRLLDEVERLRAGARDQGEGGAMTDDEHKAARALCDAATPGPWHCYHHEDYGWRIDAEKVGIVHGAWNEADGDLIAAARTLMPCLLDEIERLRGLVAAAAPGPWRDAVYGEAPKADAPLAPPVPRDASIPFEHTTLGRTTTPYRCNVPMCGESGVCDACRKRGAR